MIENGIMDSVVFTSDEKLMMFVATSHGGLTEKQVNDLAKNYGNVEVVYLKDYDADLQFVFSNVPPEATTEDVREIAKAIAIQALVRKCELFYCTGQPNVSMWANLYASGLMPFDNLQLTDDTQYCMCIESTTARKVVEQIQEDATVKITHIFEHVQWRNLFLDSDFYGDIL
jgi:hypothetical protein